jgi:hypothetical protein
VKAGKGCVLTNKKADHFWNCGEIASIAGGKYLSEMISEEDMARVDVGMRHAIGIG